jgi:hypothetical protein
MIRTKRVEMLSGKVIGAFGPHAKVEWKAAKHLRREWYASLDGLWVISDDKVPLCVLGLKRGSYLGLGGEVFFLLCDFPKRHTAELIKFLRRGLRRVTPPVAPPRRPRRVRLLDRAPLRRVLWLS